MAIAVEHVLLIAADSPTSVFDFLVIEHQAHVKVRQVFSSLAVLELEPWKQELHIAQPPYGACTQSISGHIERR
jgi:hypothetical protein